MKFLLFIDKVYSKIMTFFLLLSIPFAAAAIYLYMNLPNIIPVQFGLNLEPSNWGNKATVFIFPIVLLIVPVFMSRKTIDSQEKSIAGKMVAEIITIVVLALILIIMIGIYYFYFKLV